MLAAQRVLKSAIACLQFQATRSGHPASKLLHVTPRGPLLGCSICAESEHVSKKFALINSR
jgi:hypothetical protein